MPTPHPLIGGDRPTGESDRGEDHFRREIAARTWPTRQGPQQLAGWGPDGPEGYARLMRLLAGVLLSLGLAACSPCDNRVSACLECGPVGDCKEAGEVCVGDPCSESNPCDEGAYCNAQGVCAPNICL